MFVVYVGFYDITIKDALRGNGIFHITMHRSLAISLTLVVCPPSSKRELCRSVFVDIILN